MCPLLRDKDGDERHAPLNGTKTKYSYEGLLKAAAELAASKTSRQSAVKGGIDLTSLKFGEY
jgi:hypothetical protein